MRIALDLDLTITRYPEFFSALSHCWPDDVYIVTFRRPNRELAESNLASFNIKYKDIIFAKNEDDKAAICKELNIEAFFDDDPDFLVHFPPSIATFLVRGESNFDYKRKQFLFTDDNGRIQKQPTFAELIAESIDPY
jgi:uncharacterized protein YozE (UPF0346 family)